MGTIGRGILSVQRLAVAGLLVFLGSPLATAAVWYVNAAATVPAPDGKGWATAYPTIQQAVDVCASGDAVWVARGVYTGTGSEVVNLKAGVTLYGGFTGTETTLDQRDWNANQAIIDGQQARGCILAEDNTATVDGFTLRNGKAHEGGGMHEGTALNCVFTGNSAIWDGGGMYEGTATKCMFVRNSAQYSGGGVCYGTATNCVFTSNSATWDGGGMFYGNAADCTFTDNTAQYRGGGVCSGTVTNCMFRCNSATAYGGGLSDGTATNCTFVQNMAVWCGGGIYDSVAANCIIWGNSPNEECGGTVSYSCLSQATPGTGNIVGAPVFVNPLAGDFRLRAGSPGIDTGTLNCAPSTDLLGRVRPQGTGVDMGAHEHMSVDDADPAMPAPILRVNAASAAASPDGLTWETAFPTLQEAADQAGYGGEMWVAAGTYTGTGAEVVRLLPGTVLLGGFAGTETARDQRDATVYRTVIDGQKARRGVTGNTTSLLDGAVVENGTAQCGGGMLHGAATNCTFTGNLATEYGGGMYLGTATNCTFTGNSAAAYGGGGMAGGTATNCTFAGNTAAYGGGMTGGTAAHCTFVRNSTTQDGGGMCGGIASNCIFVRNSTMRQGGGMCEGTATNCVFAQNAATHSGGGMYHGIAMNCTFTGNSAEYGGGTCEGTATNCIFWQNGSTDMFGTSVSYSCLDSPEAGTGNITGDPLFADEQRDDFSLAAGSPCINAGTAINSPDTDILGISRPQGAGVDMGAYEEPLVPVSVPDVTGLARAAAHDLLVAAQLYVGGETEQYHSYIPADHVIRQSPLAGVEVPADWPVDLVISKGPLMVSVPDLSGLARMAAAQTLYASRLYAGAQSEEYHPTVPQDHVIRQTPGGGAQAPLWSRVDCVLSRGPAPVSMPDIVGLERGAARDLLAAAQLSAPNETVTYHASVPANHVVSQSPTAGTQLPPGTTVSYVLSLGPVPVEGEPQPGEGEPVPPDTVREQLASAVAEADTSGDGTLSYAEAAGAVPGLTQAVFDAIDMNGDGQLSPSELAGDGDGTGCRGRSECDGPDWGARMADLLLVLLGALGLGWTSGTQRP